MAVSVRQGVCYRNLNCLSLMIVTLLLINSMKVRLNPAHKDLAFRFGISESSVTAYIYAAVTAVAKIRNRLLLFAHGLYRMRFFIRDHSVI